MILRPLGRKITCVIFALFFGIWDRIGCYILKLILTYFCNFLQELIMYFLVIRENLCLPTECSIVPPNSVFFLLKLGGQLLRKRNQNYLLCKTKLQRFFLADESTKMALPKLRENAKLAKAALAE